MKVATINDHACVVVSAGCAWRIAAESDGQFGPRMADLFPHWAAFCHWASRHQPTETFSFSDEELGLISPQPAQIFAIGLNYHEHARETGLQSEKSFPPVFPKWASSLANPVGNLAVPAQHSHIDWEVELVVAIGREARHVSREAALDYVAGYAVGQDFSDRKVQFAGQSAQWGLAKSFKGFSPVGPWLVTPDELPGGAAITCIVDGVVKQSGTLNEMIFSVADIIAILSDVVTLMPGDLIFTGTPSGVGFARQPAEYLQPGSTVVSSIAGIGELRQRVVAR
ncbi:fumarylacetoacetate hydrolase family protein [Nissabacter sp. SGAir0207]|uniref:fumarylacetoacetate hydrolase family protein n=1 Tax=Nissabacter sp. SGAir0207 TaxID=2126321 RepID=UPI0010CD2B2E|nr:fumarylacetoacetate hydrolase family protein [Nissabacter sp. SGAir0207]QCR38626.1 fumarylacetoacetate hydrolase [Nissabacter sp. SGAir0207]